MNGTMEQDDLLADAVEQLLADQCTPAVVRAIEGGGTHTALWQALEASGFADALVPEALGGAGLGLADVRALVEACGRHALPLPLAQTLLARALLGRAGGGLAIALHGGPADAPFPYRDQADAVLLHDGAGLKLLDLRSGQALARVDAAADLRAIQAALLAAQMAGAMRRVFEMTLQYANDRVQFGRSIGKFQAIQHQLAQMAEQVAAATMAARLAFATTAQLPDPLLCAVAKARTSEAVLPVVQIAHAVHGAIGITAEYDLQLYTRRLQAWRSAAGSESYWNQRIGRALLDSDMSVPDFARLTLSPTN